MLHAGVRWSSYGENPHLQDFFKVLSLSADRDERIYISTIEAHKVRSFPVGYIPHDAGPSAIAGAVSVTL